MLSIRQPDRMIPYKRAHEVTLNLHIFEPSAASRTGSAIVFFFGGGWNGGTPAQFYPQASCLSDRGMWVACAEYRVHSRHHTDPRAALADAKSAMRWVRAHARELNIDSHRIAAGGGSAGGHLAAATAFCPGFSDEPENDAADCRPDALVLYNPVIDNSREGYGYDRVKPYWQDFSPLHNIRNNPPPTLFMLGTRDHLIPVSTGAKFCEAISRHGGLAIFKTYSDAPHGFFNLKDDHNPFFDQTMNDVIDFLEKIEFLNNDIKTTT
ncbi:MAG: alpha/beta hydrolase [Lentisphaerae bacterium]|nr:MAG: alpha/beta hydrolase [Lentisphaerota bacterium]